MEEVEAEHPLVLVHHPVRLPPRHGGEGEGRHHAQRRRQIAAITRAHLRGAERDDAAARPEDAPVATQGRRPEGVEDDVHTLAARQPSYLGDDVLRVVVDGLVGSLLPHASVLGRRRTADDKRTEVVRQLCRRDAHAAAG